MNLLGRIFVVLNLVLSLVFMTLAIGVWAINRNYVGAIAQARSDKQNLESQLSAAQTQRDELAKQLNAEQAVKRMQIASLEQSRSAQQQAFAQLQQQQAETQNEASRLTTAIQAQQQQITNWTSEVQETRATLLSAQQKRDELWEVARTKTDAAAQMAQQVDSLEAINDQLNSRLDVAEQTLDANNIRAETASAGVVEGLVVQVEGRLVAINIGSDDGVRTGDSLEIVNGSRYLGRIKILRVKPDGAVGEILRDFQQGVIRKNDNVRSGFKVG